MKIYHLFYIYIAKDVGVFHVAFAASFYLRSAVGSP
jgi:hypothetical protein